MDGLVEPLLQRYDANVPMGAIFVVFPKQTPNGVVSDKAGAGVKAIKTESVTLQPFASVAVSLYKPGCETVIDWLVEPLFHKYD